MHAVIRNMSLLAATLALAACGSSPREEITQLPMIDPAFTATALETPGVPVSTVAADSSFVRLPSGAGRILTVRERRYVNGASQQIVLDGENQKGMENRIDISVQTQAEGGRYDLYVPISPPTESGIMGELSDRFPGMSMQITERNMNNSYGPFGLAIGRSGVMRCIYAWQWISDLNSIRPGQVSLLSRLSLSGGTGSAPANIRVRICRKDATVDQLAVYVTQMVIGTVQTLNRLLAQGGPADPGSADRRVAFSTPANRTASLEAELGTPAPVAKEAPRPRQQTRVATRRARPKVEVAEQPQQQAQPVLQAIPAYQQNVSGPRYLAPVAGSNTGYRAPTAPAQASPYMTPPPPTGSRLDSSLPAAAYQGPRAQRRPAVPGTGTYNY